MATTDLVWIMNALDDVKKIDDSRVCACNYQEDQKNQKILVGYGSLAETSVLFAIAPISSQQKTRSSPLRLAITLFDSRKSPQLFKEKCRCKMIGAKLPTPVDAIVHSWACQKVQKG